MATHSMHRVSGGWYEYRGHTLRISGRMDAWHRKFRPTRGARWSIHRSDRSVGTARTLAEARQIVDRAARAAVEGGATEPHALAVIRRLAATR